MRKLYFGMILGNAKARLVLTIETQQQKQKKNLRMNARPEKYKRDMADVAFNLSNMRCHWRPVPPQVQA